MCPFPVAARLPYSVTLNREADGCLPLNISAALHGPMVWLLDGPMPILYMDFMLSTLFLLQFGQNSCCTVIWPGDENVGLSVLFVEDNLELGFLAVSYHNAFALDEI